MRRSLLAGLVLLTAACQPASPSPSASGSGEPTNAANPLPSTLAGSDLDLRTLAWWDEQTYEVGYTDAASSLAPLPRGYKEVRIGTLDGRVTAVLDLNEAWSHSYVSGPVGTDVVVVNDDGTTSTIWLLSAVDGKKAVLKEDHDLVPAAALSPTGDEVFYVKIDRRTGIDRGLWRRSNTTLMEDMPLLGPAPLSDAMQELSVWQVLTTLDGKTVIVQVCVGEVRCTTHFIDVATATDRDIVSIGWPIGITDNELLARGLGSDSTDLVAVDLTTRKVRTLLPAVSDATPVRAGNRWLLAYDDGGAVGFSLLGVGDGVRSSIPDDRKHPSRPAFLSLQPHPGVRPPDGWILLWRDGPTPIGFSQAPVPAQLVNVVTGERLDLPIYPGIASPSP